MRYGINDMFNPEIYENMRVAFCLGRHDLFINLVSDTLRDGSISDMGRMIMDMPDSEDMKEFGVADDNVLSSMMVNIDTFFSVVDISNMYGKWFCRADLSILRAGQKEKIEKYIRSPSENGILVITSNDFKDYSKYLKNRALLNSRYSHIIQLDFPNKSVLKNVAMMLFEDKHLKVTNAALEMFVLRMNREYDKYEEVIDMVHMTHDSDEVVDQGLMKDYLEGIEYFGVDDLMSELVKPLANDMTNNKKVFRMLSSLLEQYKDAEKLANEIERRISEFIDFRIMINRGYIPIGINYFVSDSKKYIDEESKYQKMGDIQFRKKADMSSRTSIRDWEFIDQVLNRALETGFHNTAERRRACEKALYFMVTRSTITAHRIYDHLGICRTLHSGIEELDRVVYDEEALRLLKDGKAGK